MEAVSTLERESLEDILASHPFLDGMGPAHLEFITMCAKTMYFEEGEYLLNEREEAEHFFLIHTGTVLLGATNPGRSFTIIQTVGDGEIVGWSWLVPPHRWHFNARVAQPTVAVVVDAKRLRQKCDEDHDFGYELLKRMMVVIWERLRPRENACDHVR